MIISFFLNDVSIKIAERLKLKSFIIDLFKFENTPLKSVTYIFCSDEYLLGINKEFLRHDDYTDIITFTLSESTEAIIGEVYISADRIKENAKLLKIPVTAELHRIIFHGALHLCGYKDKSPADKIVMTMQEDKYLNMYFG